MSKLSKVTVQQFEGRKGPVKNQFIIRTADGVYFQSYNSIIIFQPYKDGKTLLDAKFWDYSKTTGKYRNQFLNETKAETAEKLNSGVYEFADLNGGK